MHRTVCRSPFGDDDLAKEMASAMKVFMDRNMELVSSSIVVCLFHFIDDMCKFGRVAYHFFDVSKEPHVLKDKAMVVQLGYRPGTTRRAKAFDCITFAAFPIPELLPTNGDEAPVAREHMLEAVKGGDTALIKFQAKQVVYVEKVVNGIKDKEQIFVGRSVDLFANVSGLADLEGPFSTYRSDRFNYLKAQVMNLIQPSPPVYVTV